MLEAIRYNNGRLQILDQLQLPFQTVYLPVKCVQDAWDTIHKMQVRGAPAIAIVGCLSLVVELSTKEFVEKDELHQFIKKNLNHLVKARPTAVNMEQAANALMMISQDLATGDISTNDMKSQLIKKIEDMLDMDVKINKLIGKHGAEDILKHSNDNSVSVLTHCNTGSLATAGYGTALGVIRSLHLMGRLNHAYCTETRPYNQGARLTAYELVHDKIPATLICDSMVGYLMQQGKVSAVVVGADRVVANGDTANKIGTYQIAVCAKHHGIPFYVASPCSTIDLNLEDGNKIKIEERPAKEMLNIQGIPVAAPGIHCWNPAFDVTPADLITGGIITEQGVFPPADIRKVFS